MGETICRRVLLWHATRSPAARVYDERLGVGKGRFGRLLLTGA